MQNTIHIYIYCKTAVNNIFNNYFELMPKRNEDPKILIRLIYFYQNTTASVTWF